jgi:hypothetical protein
VGGACERNVSALKHASRMPTAQRETANGCVETDTVRMPIAKEFQRFEAREIASRMHREQLSVELPRERPLQRIEVRRMSTVSSTFVENMFNRSEGFQMFVSDIVPKCRFE